MVMETVQGNNSWDPGPGLGLHDFCNLRLIMRILFFLLLFVGTAFAQVYPPIPIPGQPLPPDLAIECLSRATTVAQMTQQQAFQLCQGAESTSPLECYQQSQTSLIDPAVAVRLCRCARTTDRVSCYNTAKNTTTLNTAQILDLCTHDVAGFAGRCDPSVPTS
jgi:hypothetical protein